MRSWSWSWVPWVSGSKGPLQPWEIQLLFWTRRIFSPQSHFESSNDLFLSPGCWEAAWGISCREGLWEWLLPGSTRVPAVRRRRRRPLLLLPLVCYEKLRENDNWRNVCVEMFVCLVELLAGISPTSCGERGAASRITTGLQDHGNPMYHQKQD